MTNIIEIECYKAPDGKLFEEYRDAKKYTDDLLGEALDDLLPNDDRGNVTRTDRFNLLMKMIEDENLKQKIATVHQILNFDGD